MASSAYDFSLTVGDTTLGLMLAKDENGNKIWNEGVSPLATAQTRLDPFSYESIPVDIDHPISFEDYSSGGGFQSFNSTGKVTGYNYSRGLDLSDGDSIFLSPRINRYSYTFSLGTASQQKFQKVAVTSLGVFACDFAHPQSSLGHGGKIYKFNTQNQVWDEVEVQADTNFSDIAELDGVIYVAAGTDQYYYSSDGTTWTQYTDDTTIEPKFFAIRGDVLWMVDASGNVRNTTDGQNGQVPWSNSDRVADSASAHFNAGGVGSTSDTVTGFIEAGDILWVFKRNGIWTYDGQEDDDFYKESLIKPNNGKWPYRAVDGNIYVAYGNRLLAIDPTSSSIIPVYPTPPMNSTEVMGDITSICGDGNHIYFIVKNEFGRPYMMKGKPSTGVWHTFHHPYLIRDTGYTWPSAGANDEHFSPTDDLEWTPVDTDSLKSGLPSTVTSAQNQTFLYEESDGLALSGYPVGHLIHDNDDIRGVEFRLIGGSGGDESVREARVYMLYDGEPVGSNRSFDAEWPISATTVFIHGAEDDRWETNFDPLVFRNSPTGFFYAVTLLDGDGNTSSHSVSAEMKVHYNHRGPDVNYGYATIIDGAEHLGTKSPTMIMVVDDELQHMKLVRSGLSPIEDGEYEVDTTLNTSVVFPWIDFGARLFTKFLNEGEVLAHNVSSAKTVTLEYQLESEEAYTTLVSSTNNGVVTDSPDSVVEFYRIRPRVIVNANEVDVTPEVQGVVLHATHNPPRKRVWQPRIMLGDNLQLRGNSRGPIASAVVKKVLQDSPTKRCSMTDREGNVYTVRVLDAIEPSFTEQRRGGAIYDEGFFDLQIVEINQTSTSVGTSRWGIDRWGSGKVWAE